MATCKPQIRVHLNIIQGKRCAYCEGDLDVLGCHIEHLWSRHTYPQRTFDWSNLFWSCDREDSCGHFKDRHGQPYDPAALIDPCRDDPDHFFRIRNNGRIEVRASLDERERQRANETLRVFNLNLDHDRGGRSLCAEQRRVLEFYRNREPDFLEEMEALEPEEREAFIRCEIESTALLPFGSILRHFLSSIP